MFIFFVLAICFIEKGVSENNASFTSKYQNAIFKLHVIYDNIISDVYTQCTCVNVGNFHGFNLLLTSAHCLQEDSYQEDLEFSTTRVRNEENHNKAHIMISQHSQDGAKMFIVIVDNILIHPKYFVSVYTRGIEEFDVATIITKYKYFDSHVNFEEEAAMSELLHILDYGKYKSNNQDVDINHIQITSNSTFEYFNTIVVAHTHNRRPCHGSSGAPILNEQGYILGLLSSGTPCIETANHTYTVAVNESQQNTFLTAVTFFTRLSNSDWFLDIYRGFVINNMTNQELFMKLEESVSAHTWLSRNYKYIAGNRKLTYFLIHSLTQRNMSKQLLILSEHIILKETDFNAQTIINLVVSSMQFPNLELITYIIDGMYALGCVIDRDLFVQQTAVLMETHSRLRMAGILLLQRYKLHNTDLVHLMLLEYSFEQISIIAGKHGYKVKQVSDAEVEVEFKNKTNRRLYSDQVY